MSQFRLLSLLLGIQMFAFTDASSQTLFDVVLRDRHSTESLRGPEVVRHRTEKWQASETAIIVCDVWDYHHCLRAVDRIKQFAPRLNQVLADARRRGVTVIHAPSDCMDAYQDHPARRRAQGVPQASYVPDEIEAWCSVVPAEENAVYPIDQSDGGEDDDPQEHAAWAAELKSLGRNPNMPWKKQSELIDDRRSV